MDVTQIRLCSLEESLELVNCRRHLTNLQKEKKKTYTKMMLLIKNVDSLWYVPFGAWCSGPFAIAAISIHPYLPSWLVPDRSLRHGHSNVCVIHLCKCVCEGGKTFFLCPYLLSSSQNLYQELGYVPHRGSLLIVWAVRMLHAVGICADIMVVRLCAAHTLVCTCAHVYALPCELAYRCSSPLPPLIF